jgi:CRP-like cAMP-binding protein
LRTPPATLEAFAANLERVTVPADSQVFAQGDAGDRFYLIAEGEAAAAVDGQARSPLRAGDWFGEIALLRAVPRMPRSKGKNRPRCVRPCTARLRR